MERPFAVALAVAIATVTAPAAVADHGMVGTYNPDVDRAWDQSRDLAAEDLPTLVRAVGAALADAAREQGEEDVADDGEGLSRDAAVRIADAGESTSDDPLPENDRVTWEEPAHRNQQEDPCGGTVAYVATAQTHYLCLDAGEADRTGLYAETNGCEGLQTVPEDVSGCGFVQADADCTARPTACGLVLGGTDGAQADLTLP